MVEKEGKANPLKEMGDIEKSYEQVKLEKEEEEMLDLEKDTLKRLKKKEKVVKGEKVKRHSAYVKTANRLFSKLSLSLYKKPIFSSLRRDLIRGNLQFLPVSYISTIFFTTLLAVIFAFIVFLFFLFFNLQIKLPFITIYDGDFFPRLLKTIWILVMIPLGTFLIAYLYPSIEKNYIKNKINQELPFVAIHMSSIAGSMVEPEKMFEIITATEEYPYTSKEFRKIINETNIYGSNLVSAIKLTSFNTSSLKLAELLNGLAMTITSGGSLEQYLEKKAESLLFDYRLEREKYTRTAETFMDIYISVVIAAPMILMLLLLMIKISGFGIDLTTQMITIIIVGGVSAINVIFITFLNLKQPES